MSEYDDQAAAFMQRFGIDIAIKQGSGKSPSWAEARHDDDNRGGEHGTHYRVSVWRTGHSRGGMFFDYWGSVADREAGQDPSYYDILSTLSLDSTAPDAFDDYLSEYGVEIKSKADVRQVERGIAFGERIRSFFTVEELEALGGIR